jgi:hypothetical protein
MTTKKKDFVNCNRLTREVLNKAAAAAAATTTTTKNTLISSMKVMRRPHG